MEILFCDLCNESIPANHLEAGKAFRRGGRLTCASCDLAMGGGGAPDSEAARRHAEAGRTGPGPRALGSEPAGPSDTHRGSGHLRDEAVGAGAHLAAGSAPGARSAAGVGVGLLSLLVAGLGLGLLVERLEQTEEQMESLAQELTSQQRQSEATLRAQGSLMEGRLAELAAGMEQRGIELGAGLEARLEVLGQQDEEQLASLAQLRAEVTKLAGEASGVAAARAATIAKLEEKLSAMESDQAFYGERLAQLDEQLRAVETMRPGTFGAGPSLADATGSEGAATGPAPWEGLLPDLGHQHAGIRMEAVYELAETGDERVVPHLIPMLRDEDLFVRMATTRALMDLSAKAGVPGLIDTLEDASSPVREAAMVALRRITGREFGFEPQAAVSQRATRVKAWREWWNKEGEDFLIS